MHRTERNIKVELKHADTEDNEIANEPAKSAADKADEMPDISTTATILNIRNVVHTMAKQM